MEEEIVRWGLIGCGDVTEVKSGPAFNKVPKSKLVVVMRRDAAKAEDYAARHGIANWSSNAEDVLSSASINAVYVATPPSSHKDYVISALRRGLNVYVEKPIAMNSSEAQQIQLEMAKSDAKLSVAHYRRQLPMFVYVKELLDSGTIGTVRNCNIRCWKHTSPQAYSNPNNWRLNPAVSGGGYFHDLAPHQLDILVNLFGYPVGNKGMSSMVPVSPAVCSGEGEELNCNSTVQITDTVCGISMFPNGIVFQGSWCFSALPHQYTDECIIIGSEGSIRFPFFGVEGSVTLSTPSAQDVVMNYKHPTHIQEPMIQEVVNYFRTNRSSTIIADGVNPCSLQDAIVVMDMMDAYTAVP